MSLYSSSGSTSRGSLDDDVKNPFSQTQGEAEQFRNAIMEEFHTHQKRRVREQGVQGPESYGGGLSKAALDSVQKEMYDPATVLPTGAVNRTMRISNPIASSGNAIPEPSELRINADASLVVPTAATRALAGTQPLPLGENGLESAESSLMKNLEQLRRNVDERCHPVSFEVLLECLELALRVVQRGDLSETVWMPFPRAVETGADHPAAPDRETGEQKRRLDRQKIVGAEAMMTFVRQVLFENAYRVTPALHTLSWVIEYTMKFVDSKSGGSTRGAADARERILAWSVRHLAPINLFHAVLLSLRSMSDEYEAFTELRGTTEALLHDAFSQLMAALSQVLSCRFPYRRKKLETAEPVIKSHLGRVVTLLTELDAKWSSSVQYHAEWKSSTVLRAYQRIHGDISKAYLVASLGFIDKSMYQQVMDITSDGTTRVIPLASRLATERVDEGRGLVQLAVERNGSPSKLVGLQLCMGSRYVLGETGKEFDSAWRFQMGEQSTQLKQAITNTKRAPDATKKKS